MINDVGFEVNFTNQLPYILPSKDTSIKILSVKVSATNFLSMLILNIPVKSFTTIEPFDCSNSL